MAKKLRGAGDLIETVAKKTGLDKLVGKDCGCQERKAWANEKLNFVNTIGGCMTDDQIEHYEALQEKYFTNTKGKSQVLWKDQDDLKLLMNLYNSIHGTNVKRCQGCSINVYWDRISKVYNNLKK